MKKLSLTLVLLAIVAISFSQAFYIHTANSSGSWTNAANWNTTLRTDGVQKNKVLVPKNITIIVDNDITIIVDNDVNSLGLGDVEIVLHGSLNVLAGTNLNLSYNSSIQMLGGSIIGSSANQKIKIGSDIKYKGNIDGTLTGYFITDNTTGSSPNGFIIMSILPINFTSFYISKSGENVQLTWSADNEKDNSHFDVQRSFNGIDWQTIAQVSRAGNSHNANNYSYNDKTIKTPVVYYRLRQVDTDSHAIFSSIKTIRLGEPVSVVRVYGTNREVVIELNTFAKKGLLVSVVNISGQTIRKQTITNPSYKIVLNLSNAPRGTYTVQVSDNEGWREARKVFL